MSQEDTLQAVAVVAMLMCRHCPVGALDTARDWLYARAIPAAGADMVDQIDEAIRVACSIHDLPAPADLERRFEATEIAFDRLTNGRYSNERRDILAELHRADGNGDMP